MTKRAAKKTKTFPAMVYIRRHEEGTSDEYLAVNETAQDAAELGADVEVGEYELRRVVRIVARVDIET